MNNLYVVNTVVLTSKTSLNYEDEHFYANSKRLGYNSSFLDLFS